MQGIALYRKYRPESFKDVVGQDHIVKVLSGAIEQGNVSHAYLFAGSRGTGKTSIARIVARELGTVDDDLFELDAASNRGIDDVRSIREAVVTLPFKSKYKVYIIDEAHMLTKDAWNAFLKTLEEPPAHVIFILATTEMDKLPETILSRCQTFVFKRPTRGELRDLVMTVSKKEGFTMEASAGELIALLGDGSFRDTLGTLEKVLSFTGPARMNGHSGGDKKVSLAEVETVTGAPKNILVLGFVKAVANSNLKESLSVLGKVREAGSDMKMFLKIVLDKFRLALLLKVAPEMESDLKNEMSDEELTDMKTLIKEGSGITSVTLYELLLAYDSVGRAYEPSLPIELALIKLHGEVKKTQ